MVFVTFWWFLSLFDDFLSPFDDFLSHFGAFLSPFGCCLPIPSSQNEKLNRDRMWDCVVLKETQKFKGKGTKKKTNPRWWVVKINIFGHDVASKNHQKFWIKPAKKH